MQASPRHEGLYAHMPFFDIAFEPEDLHRAEPQAPACQQCFRQ